KDPRLSPQARVQSQRLSVRCLRLQARSVLEATPLDGCVAAELEASQGNHRAEARGLRGVRDGDGLKVLTAAIAAGIGHLLLALPKERPQVIIAVSEPRRSYPPTDAKLLREPQLPLLPGQISKLTEP